MIVVLVIMENGNIRGPFEEGHLVVHNWLPFITRHLLKMVNDMLGSGQFGPGSLARDMNLSTGGEGLKIIAASSIGRAQGDCSGGPILHGVGCRFLDLGIGAWCNGEVRAVAFRAAKDDGGRA